MPMIGASEGGWRPLTLCNAAVAASVLLVAGCGGGDSSKPAPVDQAQMKKAQEYMANYREEMVNAHKGKPRGKAAEAKPR